MGCPRNCFKVLTIVFVVLDIAVGWFKFYRMYHEAGHLEDELNAGNSDLQKDCSNPHGYWKAFVTFESIATILAFGEIYYLIREIKYDKRMFDKCFSHAWFLVVAIYIFAIFPLSILNIAFRDRCVCFEGFSLNVWQDEVRDFFKTLLGGISVISMQILLHLSEVYFRMRRILKCFKTIMFCMKFAPDNDEDMNHPCCEGTLPCFVISIVLAICYTALFITEIVFIFCVKYN